MPVRISSLSREFVKVPVTATEDGAPIDPTPYVVEVAITAEDIEPLEADWVLGSWETAGTTYLARCLVGPGGDIALDDGTYWIWVRITGSPEIPVKRGGTLVIE